MAAPGATWNEFLLVATGPPPRLPSGTVKIVGNDWYLELVSSEFGSDYWVCREMPKLPAYHTPGALASNARLHSAA